MSSRHLMIIGAVLALLILIAVYYTSSTHPKTQGQQEQSEQQGQPGQAPEQLQKLPYNPPTLTTVREAMKKRLDELEAMTPEQWNEMRGPQPSEDEVDQASPPLKVISLEEARERLRKRYEIFENLTEEEWKERTRKRNPGEPPPPPLVESPKPPTPYKNEPTHKVGDPPPKMNPLPKMTMPSFSPTPPAPPKN